MRCLSHRLHIAQAALKELFIGQYGDGRRAVLRIRCANAHRVEIFDEYPFGWRSFLDLGDERNRIPAQGCGEIAHRAGV